MSKTRLFEAIAALDPQAVQDVLTQRPDLLSATDRQGRNLLLATCAVQVTPQTEPRSVALARHLLDAGLPVESAILADGYPCTATWFAVARARSCKLVALLVARGAKPRGLFAAGWYEDLPMLKLLLKLGADIDEHAEDETPFFHCWKNRRFRAAKLLLEAGANPDFQDSKKRTAMHYALDHLYDPALVKLLVRHGASRDLPDARGLTPRTKAARKRNPGYLAALR